MTYVFPGVKMDTSGVYYYNDGDIPKVSVPISTSTEGDLKLTPAQLDYWFGIRPESMPDLPKYLIRPRLNSTWGGDTWWNITGDMVVYRPIEWVPIISCTKTFPRNTITQEFKREKTTTTTSKLYGKVESELEISGGANYMGMKVEAKLRAEASVQASMESNDVDKIITQGKLGDKVVKEVWVGMLIRVEEVFNHNVRVWIDNRGKGDSLGWSGGPGWNEILVPSRTLARVEGLQFSKIAMSGTGFSSSLYVQALPVLDEKGEFKDLHLALSNTGWQDWYAYVVGGKSRPSGRELLAWPAWEYAATLMVMDEKDGKPVSGAGLNV